MENRQTIAKIYIGNTLADLKNSFTTLLYNMLNTDISIYADDYQVRLDEHADTVTVNLPHVTRTIEVSEFIDTMYPMLKEMMLPLGMYVKKDNRFCKIVLDMQAHGTEGYCFVYLIPQEPFVTKTGIGSETARIDFAGYIRIVLAATKRFGLLTFKTESL